MEIYEIKTTCDAKVIETWHVKAGSYDEAATAFDPDSGIEKEFVSERTNDEENREIISIEGGIDARPKTDSSGKLDEITVRYFVKGRFDLVVRGIEVCAVASFSIESGVYDGIPDAETIAGLINSRGIDAGDFDYRSPDSAEAIAEVLNERGVLATDIQSAEIAEVLYSEKTIALPLDMKD